MNYEHNNLNTNNNKVFNSKYISNFDIISFFAAIAIVFLHFNVPLEDGSMIFSSGTTFAVPTFFIISGYFFENSSNKYKNIKHSVLELIFITIVLLCIISVFIEFEFNLTYSLFPYGGSLTPLWFYLHLIILKIIYYNKKDTTKILLFIFAILCIYFWGYSRTLYCSIIPFSFGIFSSKLKVTSNLKLGLTTFLIFCILLFFNIFNIHSIQYSIYSSITAYFLFLTALFIPQTNGKNTKFLSIISLNIYYFNFLIRNIIYTTVKYNTLFEAIVYSLICIIIIFLISLKYGKISYFNFCKK